MYIISALILIIYFVIYSLVHSWLAAQPVKEWVHRVFGSPANRWYRLAYNVFAVVTLLPMLALMALLPAKTLYLVPAPWAWVMVAGQLLAALAAAITLLQTGALHFLGLSQLVDPHPDDTTPLNMRGFYSWVRHPLYTFSIIFLWLSPIMTSNSLTAYILFTLYFFVGSKYEERRLLAEYGPAYERYCQSVPAIIPVPGRRYSPEMEMTQQ